MIEIHVGTGLSTQRCAISCLWAGRTSPAVVKGGYREPNKSHLTEIHLAIAEILAKCRVNAKLKIYLQAGLQLFRQDCAKSQRDSETK